MVIPPLAMASAHSVRIKMALSISRLRFWPHPGESIIWRRLDKSRRFQAAQPVVDRTTGAEPGEQVERCQANHQPDQSPTQPIGPGQQSCHAYRKHRCAKALGKAVRLRIVLEHLRRDPAQRPEDSPVNKSKRGTLKIVPRIIIPATNAANQG